MKPGTTYAYIVRRFCNGFSIAYLAKTFECSEWEVERAIRAVMVREATKRR